MKGSLYELSFLKKDIYHVYEKQPFISTKRERKKLPRKKIRRVA